MTTPIKSFEDLQQLVKAKLKPYLAILQSISQMKTQEKHADERFGDTTNKREPMRQAKPMLQLKSTLSQNTQTLMNLDKSNNSQLVLDLPELDRNKNTKQGVELIEEEDSDNEELKAEDLMVPDKPKKELTRSQASGNLTRKTFMSNHSPEIIPVEQPH